MPIVKDSQTHSTRLKFPATDIIVLAAYLILTILMTWPTILHLADGIPGDGFDGWQNLWNLWWIKKALLIEGATPYFTPLVDAPNGASLLFHTLNIFNGLWTLPIQLNFGPIPAYHAVVLASFVLAGYGVYLLSLYTLTRISPAGSGLRWAAFVGGLVFTMSPFHMAHLLGHMQVFAMIWPPFYILWLLRAFDPWANTLDPPPHQWRNAAISGLFLILVNLVSLYQTLYLLVFTGVVLLWALWRRWQLWHGSKGAEEQGESSGDKIRNTQYAIRNILRPILVVAIIGIIFALVLSPILIPTIRDANARPDLETGLFQNITLSADLLAFFLPSELHPLWGQWAKSIADNFSATTSERVIFIGYVPLALAVFIIIRRRSSSVIKFWTLIIAIYFVMALGPFLHIGGKIVAIGGWQIPMPYLLLYYTVPFINLTRSLSRYDLMIMLALGVLCSLALAQLSIINYQLSKLKAQNSKLILTAITFLILFEFLVVPYPVSIDDTPQFYANISAGAGDYTIAELPMNWDRPTPLLHQITHGKRLLTAYTSRDNPLELAWRTPVFQHWQLLGPDIIDQPLDQIAPTIFFDFNLRYIVLDYWQMPPGPERDNTEQWVAAALPNATPIYDDGRLKVYQTPPKTETQPYLTLGDGWGKRVDEGDGLITRSIEGQWAELFLHHPQNRSLNLEITAAAGDFEPLTIYADDVQIATIDIGPTLSNHTISLPPLDGQLVALKFEAGDTSHSIFVSRVSLSKGN